MNTIATHEALTRRQLEVLRLAAQGASSREMGRTLFLAEPTIGTYRKQLLKKLKAKNIAHAVAIGYEEHLLSSAGFDLELIEG